MDKNAREDTLVLDLETKKGFGEVEGKNLRLLGVSVVGIYSYQEAACKVFAEDKIEALIPYLARTKLLIGFNIIGFDIPVLQPYLGFDLRQLSVLDILEEIRCGLGFRVSLNNVAEATLKEGKLGTGLDALAYYRQGKMQELMRYCQKDVLLTRDLYEYGKRHGYLLYRKGIDLQTITVNWKQGKTDEGCFR